jgi:hypothetical protein
VHETPLRELREDLDELIKPVKDLRKCLMIATAMKSLSESKLVAAVR